MTKIRPGNSLIRFVVFALAISAVWAGWRLYAPESGMSVPPPLREDAALLESESESISKEHKAGPEDEADPISVGSRNHARYEFVPLAAPPGPTAVITAADPADSDWDGYFDAGIRSRAVILNGQLLNGSVIPEGTQLALELFDDVMVNVVVSDSLRNANGTISTTARIEGSEYGRVFIAVTDGEMHARIRDVDTQKLYAIQYNHANGIHYALELDIALAEPRDPDGCQPLIPPPLAMTADEMEIYHELLLDYVMMAGDEDSVSSAVVDVMVVYTQSALTRAGSQAALDNIIALGIAMANDAHANTATHIVVHLVHSYRVDYAGTSDNRTDLDWVTDDAEVAASRNTHGADYVILMNNSSGGGTAWLLTNPGGRPTHAFSVVAANSFASYTTVHEVGHNMGLSHADDQNFQAGPTTWNPDTFNFQNSTAGWHWHPDDNHDLPGWCCVMTYTSASYFDNHAGNHLRIGLFSDPNIIHEGQPAGHATRGDSARALRQLRHVYAGYRSRLTGTQILVDFPNGGETLTEGTTYSILWDSSGVAGNVRIELLQNGTLDSVIAANTLNDRTFAWTVPAGKNGLGYAIRISDVDTGTIMDVSDGTFMIDTPFYVEMLDANPGYTTTGGWEFGVPSGDNAVQAAYTGMNVYDTNLSGTSFTPGTLTSIAIDCSNYTNVRLSFMGHVYLNSGYTATFQVSNDHVHWTTLLSEAGLSRNNWVRYEYDISSVADGESAVYIRWQMSGGGSQWVGGGIAIDDIMLTGISPPVDGDFAQWLLDNGYPADTPGDTLAANGAHTLHEMFVAGLNPQNPESRFEIGAFAEIGEHPVLQWPGVDGRLYSVYWSSNLLEGASGFQLLQSDIPWTATTYTDAVERASEAGFYRIDVQLE